MSDTKDLAAAARERDEPEIVAELDEDDGGAGWDVFDQWRSDMRARFVTPPDNTGPIRKAFNALWMGILISVVMSVVTFGPWVLLAVLLDWLFGIRVDL